MGRQMQVRPAAWASRKRHARQRLAARAYILTPRASPAAGAPAASSVMGYDLLKGKGSATPLGEGEGKPSQPPPAAEGKGKGTAKAEAPAGKGKGKPERAQGALITV